MRGVWSGQSSKSLLRVNQVGFSSRILDSRIINVLIASKSSYSSTCCYDLMSIV